MERRLETIQDTKYEVQEMMTDTNAEDQIVDEWGNMTKQKMERYQELIDRLKGCLEDLGEKKETEIRKKEDHMQEDRLKKRMQEQLKIDEMKLR